MPAQISANMSFFLEEDDKIQVRIAQLSNDTWTVDIGQIRYDHFFQYMTFFCKSEEQARSFLKVWSESKAEALA